MSSEQRIHPELVLILRYAAGKGGWAHSMQLHPDGSADFVSHRPEQLPFGVRWISRNVDQDAMGLVLPATAEVSGYSAEKAKGNVRTLRRGGVFHCSYVCGALTPADADAMRSEIEALKSQTD